MLEDELFNREIYYACNFAVYVKHNRRINDMSNTGRVKKPHHPIGLFAINAPDFHE